MVVEGSKLKEKLIMEGTKIVQTEGMKHISLRRVAEICGVTHSSPYRHFANKNDYLKALVGQISIVFGSSIAKGITGDMKSEDILLKMGLNFVDFANNFPNYFDVLFLGDYIAHTKVKNNKLSADEYLPGFEEFKSIVQKVSSDNNISIEEDIEVVQLWSFIVGFALIVGKKDVVDVKSDWIKKVISQMIKTYIVGNQKE
ncbi:hypothetical protein FC70_GL000932 [Paucilactobacillus oligofermentans DSM 15707 = LMG 22743]|uniref:HTH tetR-type domain-containing protein n=1 Tax=Paucilactobacillus oligofermentans DSM 15707 = LMG 22743 TaxID=1423778 RepID=A0A0R1RPZ4_9LACO|nr:TetR/AcrR family transcriptional regulator [Paucilactobacillus oligofermentans]KRL55336.1 hypothetical protein FC70_GL000932 [Paucilactobacillus oligofermentans DSM 15707 = LMG 22743]CUS25673.1 TetR family transcriptional regulator [Paucilactobacillus oligofermentans DSM 15707 = LMG 22743]